MAGDGVPSGASVEDVIGRMLDMDGSRAAALRQYSSQRRYVVENPRFSQRAEVTVQELHAHPGRKAFKVISESGSPAVRHKVIDKLIEAEVDASRDLDQTRFTPRNYEFRLIGTEERDGHACYVLEVTPKTPKKYLMRGRIWVDDSDFAIVRAEGTPAKNPSFWTRKVSFVRRYEKHGPFWLPVSVESQSDILVAGKSTLRIAYSQYEINAAATEMPAGRGTALEEGNEEPRP